MGLFKDVSEGANILSYEELKKIRKEGEATRAEQAKRDRLALAGC